MEVSELYTPLNTALVELGRRRKDKALMKRVDEYFTKCPPLQELVKEPRAVVARALISPTYEILHALDGFKKIPLKPVFYEYTKDKFVGINSDKSCFGHMNFCKPGQNICSRKSGSLRVVDFAVSEGKPMKAIKTVTGETLPVFHRRLLESYIKDKKLETHDFSEWFAKSNKFSSEFPYLRYLGMFLTKGILFENFIVSDRHQKQFTNKKVIPAFKKLMDVFGVQPLIVPILPLHNDDAPFWTYYPEAVKDLI